MGQNVGQECWGGTGVGEQGGRHVINGDHSQHQHGDWSWRTSSVSCPTFIIALQHMHLKAKTEGAKVLKMFREMFLKVLIVK